MRILIVEDEKKVAQFLKKGFQAEAFAVDLALDGQEGLECARSASYDAIVLDVMLPRIDGLSVLKELRKEGNNTPILILTARTDVGDRVDGLNAGADDYLPKPFSFSEVLARVRAIVRRSSNDLRGSLLELADLRMDLAARTVKRGAVHIAHQ